MTIQKFKNGNGYYNILSEEDLQNKKIVISFSGGRTSAFMLYKLYSIIPSENIIVCFANTGREDEATLEFVRDCEKDLKMKFHWLEFDLDDNKKHIVKEVDFQSANRTGEPLAKSFEFSKVLPNLFMRMCTIRSKIETINKFLENIGLTSEDYVTCMGIRYDEPNRWSKNINQFNDISYRAIFYPLVDWYTTKQQVLDFWSKSKFDLKLVEPFGNCDLCYLKSVKKRIAVLKDRPHVAEWWSEQESKFNHTFDANYSVKQLLKIATGKTIADLSKERNHDIECNCNID